jgi:hypothetical protein
MPPKKEKAEKPAKGDAGEFTEIISVVPSAHIMIATDMVLHYLSK